MKEFTKLIRQQGMKNAFLSVVRSLDFPMLRQLEEQSIMNIPVLLITGEYDYLIHREALCHFAARNPYAKCVIIPDSRHCPHEEQPECVNRRIIMFCQQLAAVQQEVSG